MGSLLALICDVQDDFLNMNVFFWYLGKSQYLIGHPVGGEGEPVLKKIKLEEPDPDEQPQDTPERSVISVGFHEA